MKTKIWWTTLTIGLMSALLVGYISAQEEMEIRRIPPDKLKEDTEFLFKTLEEIHPNPNPYLKVKVGVLNKMDHPMSLIEFYKVLVPIIDPVTVELSDGHTLIRIPNITKDMLPCLLISG